MVSTRTLQVYVYITLSVTAACLLLLCVASDVLATCRQLTLLIYLLILYLGVRCVIAMRDRGTQTSDVITSCSPATLASRSCYTQSAPEVTSHAQCFRSHGGDETGSELVLCGRCDARLSLSDATVGRYCVLREIDDVTGSRDRRAKASLRHHPTLTANDDADTEVISNNN